MAASIFRAAQLNSAELTGTRQGHLIVEAQHGASDLCAFFIRPLTNSLWVAKAHTVYDALYPSIEVQGVIFTVIVMDSHARPLTSVRCEINGHEPYLHKRSIWSLGRLPQWCRNCPSLEEVKQQQNVQLFQYSSMRRIYQATKCGPTENKHGPGSCLSGGPNADETVIVVVLQKEFLSAPDNQQTWWLATHLE